MKKKLWGSAILTGVAMLASLSPLDGQTKTQVLVRVTANDAKIVGSGVGGARVTVREVASGTVLAQGLQEGGTGDTRKIMYTQERGATVYDTEGAAGFVAELAISEPTIVEIMAEGPLGTPDDLRSASRTMLVVPGQHVLGEGVILDLVGFTVELEPPESASELERGSSFEVRGRVTMLCGCPTEPGGIWDSDRYQIVLTAVQGGRTIGEWAMKFAGQTSWYTTEISLATAGDVQLQMIAMDPAKGNFGMASAHVTVR